MDGLGKTDESVSNEQVLNEKLAEIVHHAEMMTGASGAAIALREGDSLVTHASTGTTAPDVGSRSRIRGSFTGLVIETGEPVRCDDSDNDHRVDPAVCRALQTRSIVVVPVKVDDTVSGVLAVFASSPHSFSNVHVSAIKTLAEIAGDIIAKYRPSSGPKLVDTTKAVPHVEINRVSLEEAPGSVAAEEFGVEFVEEDINQALAALEPSPATTPSEVEQPVFSVEPVVAQGNEPVSTPEAVITPEPFLPVEVAKKSEVVIGPGSLSQSPFIPVEESPKLGNVIELPVSKREPGEVAATVAETPKADAATVLAMAAAAVPSVKPKVEPVVEKPVELKPELDVKPAKFERAIETSAPAKREEAKPVKAEPVLTLADEPLFVAKSDSKQDSKNELSGFDLPPQREFSFFKYAVPVGLAAALAIAGWFYFTKWRNHADATNVAVVQQGPASPVVDPITAAANAQGNAQQASGTPSGLHPASLNTATSAATQAPPPAEKAAVVTEAQTQEELEPEVVTTGPKPLVVQNAGAPRPMRAAQVATADAPQVLASANLPTPLLDVKSKMPELKAKQSSLVPNQLMKSVAPVYPESARRLNVAGSVTVEAQVGADGKVKNVKVLDGDPMLARAAVTAVKQWKYRPSYLNGDPVDSTARIVLNFKPQN